MENKEWVMPTHIIAGAGIVINENNEVLMVKTHNAGWVFPGGQVEVGENVIDAVPYVDGGVYGGHDRSGYDRISLKEDDTWNRRFLLI